MHSLCLSRKPRPKPRVLARGLGVCPARLAQAAGTVISSVVARDQVRLVQRRHEGVEALGEVRQRAGVRERQVVPLLRVGDDVVQAA
jgi:hypothetical protein